MREGFFEPWAAHHQSHAAGFESKLPGFLASRLLLCFSKARTDLLWGNRSKPGHFRTRKSLSLFGSLFIPRRIKARKLGDSKKRFLSRGFHTPNPMHLDQNGCSGLFLDGTETFFGMFGKSFPMQESLQDRFCLLLQLITNTSNYDE